MTKEKIINIDPCKQIILSFYDWRNALLDIQIRFLKLKLYHFEIEFLRLKFSYHDYGEIF